MYKRQLQDWSGWHAFSFRAGPARSDSPLLLLSCTEQQCARSGATEWGLNAHRAFKPAESCGYAHRRSNPCLNQNRADSAVQRGGRAIPIDSARAESHLMWLSCESGLDRSGSACLARHINFYIGTPVRFCYTVPHGKRANIFHEHTKSYRACDA